MRLLETSAPLLSFANLGFPPEIAERITQLLALPQGMLLVTGPTGSGQEHDALFRAQSVAKTGSQYRHRRGSGRIRVAGNQPGACEQQGGLTFASCLRSILRQDPNVIMVGEIRDLETAEIAMKAAQTGHLVLSTLHTNDSISAVARLLDLGIPEYLIASRSPESWPSGWCESFARATHMKRRTMNTPNACSPRVDAGSRASRAAGRVLPLRPDRIQGPHRNL